VVAAFAHLLLYEADRTRPGWHGRGACSRSRSFRAAARFSSWDFC